MPVESKQFAYVLYLTGPREYAEAAVIAAARLIRMGKRQDIDIVLLHSGRLCRRHRSLFRGLGIEIKKVPRLSCKGDRTWKHSATKLHVFRLTQYRRVVYLDADCLVLRHMDELFDFPDSDIMMPPVYWSDEQPYTSCLMLIKPSELLWRRVHRHWKQTRGLDMAVINEALADKIVPLPDIYGSTTGDFQGPDFPKGNPDARYAEVPHVHFSSWPLAKPWLVNEEDLLTYAEEHKSHPRFLDIYRTWQAERSALLTPRGGQGG